MAADRCGLVECRAEGLRVCGCLGLLALPLPPPPPAAVLVYPVPEPPGILELPEGLGTPRPVPRGKSPSGEDYELRPYREGDSLRTVEPDKLVFRWSSWYLHGWCRDRDDWRLFKLGRMLSLETLEETFSPRPAPWPITPAEQVYPGRLQAAVRFAPSARSITMGKG